MHGVALTAEQMAGNIGTPVHTLIRRKPVITEGNKEMLHMFTWGSVEPLWVASKICLMMGQHLYNSRIPIDTWGSDPMLMTDESNPYKLNLFQSTFQATKSKQHPDEEVQRTKMDKNKKFKWRVWIIKHFFWLLEGPEQEKTAIWLKQTLQLIRIWVTQGWLCSVVTPTGSWNNVMKGQYLQLLMKKLISNCYTYIFENCRQTGLGNHLNNWSVSTNVCSRQDCSSANTISIHG